MIKNKNELFDGYDCRKLNNGRPVVIEAGSKDEYLLVNWLEDNLGFRRATEFLNEHRVNEGRLPVGRSAVMNAFNRMSPKINRIQKTVQEGISAIWITARFNQVKQLLVMQGIYNRKTSKNNATTLYRLNSIQLSYLNLIRTR